MTFPIAENNLILTGYTGPRQVMLARQVADVLRMTFVNVEHLIAERVDLPPDQVRAYFGETRLKTVETEIVAEATLRRNTVIHVSGRTLLHGDFLPRLMTTGPVIYLHIALDAMLHRLHVSMGARYNDPSERDLALGNLKREWAIRGTPGLHEIDVTYQEEAAVITAITID